MSLRTTRADSARFPMILGGQNLSMYAIDIAKSAGGNLNARIDSAVTAIAGKQAQLNGTGFVKQSGTTTTYTNPTKADVGLGNVINTDTARPDLATALNARLKISDTAAAFAAHPTYSGVIYFDSYLPDTTGLVDNSAKIAQAVTDARTTGKALWVSPGSYGMLSTIDLQTSASQGAVRIVGMGGAGSVLGNKPVRFVRMAASTAPLFRAHGRGLEFENVTFDGNGTEGALMLINRGFEFKLTKVRFYNSKGYGLLSRALSNAKLLEVNFDRLGKDTTRTDGAITSAGTTFTSAAANFVQADTGTVITVLGAGSAGDSLITTITAVTDAHTVTLKTAASATVSAATYRHRAAAWRVEGSAVAEASSNTTMVSMIDWERNGGPDWDLASGDDALFAAEFTKANLLHIEKTIDNSTLTRHPDCPMILVGNVRGMDINNFFFYGGRGDQLVYEKRIATSLYQGLTVSNGVFMSHQASNALDTVVTVRFVDLRRGDEFTMNNVTMDGATTENIHVRSTFGNKAWIYAVNYKDRSGATGNRIVDDRTESSRTPMNLPSNVTAFNTADQVTNYEKFEAKWLANEYYLQTIQGGTGTARNLVINGNGLKLQSNGSTRAIITGNGIGGNLNVQGTNSSANASAFGVTQTFTNTSGTTYGIASISTSSTTSTGKHVGLWVSEKYTALGGGALVASLGYNTGASGGGTDVQKWTMDTTGAVNNAGTLTVGNLATGTGTDSVVVVNNGLLKKVLPSAGGGSYDTTGKNFAYRDRNNSFSAAQTITGALTASGKTVFGTTSPALSLAGQYVAAPSGDIIQVLADNSQQFGLTYQYSTGVFNIFSDYYGGGPGPSLLLGSYPYRGNQLLLSNNGQVGVREATPTQTLDVGGSFRAQDSAIIAVTSSGPSTDSVVTIGASGVLHKRNGAIYQYDTTGKFTAYQTALNTRVNYSDTASMLLNYKNGLLNRALINATNTFAADQNITGELFLTKTTEQMRLAFDVSNYGKVTVGSTGQVTWQAVGTSPSFQFLNGVVMAGNMFANATNTRDLGTSAILWNNGYFRNVQLGLAGTTQGILNLSGATSGTVAVTVQAAAGSYNYNLPTTAGVAGDVLTSGGGSTSPMTWTKQGTTAFVAKSAAYTATAVDYTITGNATSAAFNITLPTAVGITGRTYIVKKIDASANAVTIATTSSQTIDGSTTKALGTQWQYAAVTSDGANWIITANN